MKIKKAQSAVELMIVLGVVMFFFISFILALELQTADKTQERKRVAFQEVALSLAEEIEIASSASDGYRREFLIQETIMNQEYNITLVDGLIYLASLDGKQALAFPVEEITGQPIIGNNVIRKVDGQVFLNS